MKRGWFLLLALSVGMNAGLLCVQLAGRERIRHEARFMRPPPPGAGLEPERAAAPPPGPARAERLAREHLGRMARHLDLDEKQESAIADLLRNTLPPILAQQEAMHEARGRMADYYAGPGMDPDGFRARARELQRVQARLDSLVAEAMIAEAQLLTAEQRRAYAGVMPWGRPMPPPRAPNIARPGDLE